MHKRVYTVALGSIQTPFTFFYFVVVQPDAIIIYIYLFFLIIPAHNDQTKTEF